MLLCVSLISALVIYVIAVFLMRENILHIYIALLFSISLSMYFQGTFLNVNLPVLDGTAVNWQVSQFENIFSVGFWVLCIIICLSLMCLRKEKTEKIMKDIAYFISAVQMISLVILTVISKNIPSAYSIDDQFTIGSENNVIIFVVDTLQAAAIEEYIASDAYQDGILDDFTFFDNAVSGAAPTHIALPLLLTGMEYDPTQSLESYSEEIWEGTEFYSDLHNNGYNVCLYTTYQCLPNPPVGTIDNFEAVWKYSIADYLLFSQQLCKLVNFYLMPHCFKQYFWLPDNTVQGLDTGKSYDMNDPQFYSDLKSADELEIKYENAFRLYHLNGVHTPYNMNENAEPIDHRKEYVTEQRALQGNFKIIQEYIEKLKEADVYEKSTIMILGDHGRHAAYNVESNPAVLIKLPYETHKLAYDSSPIHFRNIVSTITGTFMDDYSHYGPSVYDISEDSDVERLHTVDDTIRMRTDLKDAYNTVTEYTRLIIDDEADSDTYQVWNPYEINRIQYQIGDKIDFTTDNLYAEQINYRLYKENGAAVASNELSICFELENIPKEDLEFHFVYSDLYNDSQKMRLYATGNKVENIVCTPDGIGQENISVISKDYIDDGKLVLRMVFPGAVTPNQLDRDNPDTRVLSVVFTSMWLE